MKRGKKLVTIAIIIMTAVVLLGECFIFKAVTSNLNRDSNDNPEVNLVRKAASTWYYENWMYRRKITVNNTANPNTLIGYQIPINLTYDSDMLPDFSDIRFTWYNTTDGTETEIPYWIESKIDSSWAYIWIKVPEITANEYETIYMYYGNPSAASTSDPSIIVVNLTFYNNNGGSFNETDQYYWTHVPGSPNLYVSFKSSENFTPPVVLEADFNLTHWYESIEKGQGHTGIGFGIITLNGFVDNWASDVNGVWYQESSGDPTERGGYLSAISGGAGIGNHFSATIDSTKKTVKIVWTPSEVRLYFNNELKANLTTNIPTVPLPVTYGSWTNTDVGYESGGCLFKPVKVRKYTDPEPTYVIGEEESKAIPALTWYFKNWLFRRKIIINNTVNTQTLLDYQVPINITYDSNMQPDFSDVRFTWYNASDGSEIEIPYWIETKINSSWAYVWVKVPQIPASDYTTIYVYYGSTTLPVGSKSNGDLTFNFFDDFAGDIFDPNKWAAVDNFTLQNGYAITDLTSGFVGAYITSSYNLSSTYIAEMLFMFYNRNYNYDAGSIDEYLDNDNLYSANVRWDGGIGQTEIRVKTAGTTTVYEKSYPTAVGVWYKLAIVRNDTNNIKSFVNEQLQLAVSATYLGSNSILRISAWESDIKVDWVRVRKYAYPEPTYSIGVEEQKPTFDHIVLKWRYATGAAIEQSSPTIGDVDNDGNMEVIVGSNDKYVYCLNGENGAVKWRYQTGARVISSPAVWDINNDGKLEIVVGSEDSQVYCLNWNGTLLWSYATNWTVFSSPAIGDVNDDGKTEVVICSWGTDGYGHIYCLLGENGTLLWNYTTGGYISSSPVLGDVDNDGKLEIVVGSDDTYVYCLSGENGALKWRYKTYDWVSSSPVLGDVDNDGNMEVVIGSGDTYIYCLNWNGTLKWKYKTGSFVASSPALGDIDNDGKLDIVFGSADHHVYCLFGENGTLKWIYEAGDHVSSSPVLADVDNDGRVEVLVGSNDYNIYCLSWNGTLLWNYTTNHYVDSSPALGDIDNDGELEIVVGSRDNFVYCFDVVSPFSPVYRPTAFLWPSIGFRGDIWHSGCYIDSDHDGLIDVYEKIVGTKANDADTDNDGLTDYQEFTHSTSPFKIDTDGDGLLDGTEVKHGTNPIAPDGPETPPQTLWKYLTNSSVISSPALGDIDNDGEVEVAFIGFGPYGFVCLSWNGTLKWNYGISGESSPALGDINNDGKLEIIVGSRDNNVYCLSWNGTKLWNYTTGYFVMSSPAISDVDGDGRLEVIVGSNDGFVYCLSWNGTLKWKYKTYGEVRSSPALGDINNDGKLEIIVGSRDNNVYCLSWNGTKLWNYTTGNGVYSSPSLGDIDCDGEVEVLFGSSDHYIYCLSWNGSLEWRYLAIWDIRLSSPALGDIDGDGYVEVVIGGGDGFVYCLSWNGTLKWKYGTGGSIESSPALGDVDGDGRLEVVFGSSDNYVYCLDIVSGFRVYWEGLHGSTSFMGTRNLIDVDPDLDFLSTYSEKIVGTNSTDPDTDGDGLPDGWEISYNLNATNSEDANLDKDNDGLTNLEEYVYKTFPDQEDTDGDGLPDGWEVQYGLNPRSAGDASVDSDNDGLTNLQEYQLGTDPKSADSDSDAMPDGWEVQYGLNPLINDSGGDLDNDALTNLEEYQLGTSPVSSDTDGDGMSDGWEVNYNLNPLDTSDAPLDPDNDGLTNLEEYQHGTSPVSSDTDKDGMPDGWEVRYGLNPTTNDANGDPDGDGLTNLEEYELGTNPKSSDTDGDGFPDGYEVSQGYDPTDPNSRPEGPSRPEIGGLILYLIFVFFPILLILWLKSGPKLRVDQETIQELEEGRKDYKV